MKKLGLLATLLAVSTMTLAQSEKSAPALQRLAKSDRSGTAWSVRVPDGAMVFTGLVTASPISGDARAQADGALLALGAILSKAGSDFAQVARLNAYATDDAAANAVEAAVAARFASRPVAFTLIRTPLAVAGAKVAFEAVAATSRAPASVEIVEPGVAVMPAGGKIFISGQVQRGTDLGTGARATMGGLFRSLEHVGLKKSDVVQVKAFIKPFSDHAAATREIVASFGDGPVPPIVLIEWVSDIFTEIELVASAKVLPAVAGDNIAYSWLPWLTRSPRYCNVAHVMPGTPLIFIGAVEGGEGDARAQMKAIFERIGSVLFDAGSSYRNLAKATYYLKDPATRALLGDIRGVYFDPLRPPAASALGVNALPRAGRAAMIDLIAVPVK